MSLTLFGCAIPDGRFGCTGDSDCPAGFVCRASDDRCWRNEGETDAGTDTAGLDVPRADAPPPDTNRLDVPMVPMDVPGLDARDAGTAASCPVPLVDGQCVDAISAHYTTCAVRPAGGVRCWGYNGPGAALGDGITDHPTDCLETAPRDCSPATVAVGFGAPAFDGIVGVAGGDEANCAWNGAGEVRCWGVDLFDGVGAFSTNLSAAPGLVVRHVGMRAPIAVLVGSNLRVGGTDLQGTGVFGDGTDSVTPVRRPVPMPALPGTWDAVDVGWYHLCAVDTGGQVLCWGKNTQGECGGAGGAGAEILFPVEVTDMTDVTALAVGDAFSCALFSDGTVTCWGWNERGQLGLGLTGSRLTADPRMTLPGLSDVVEIDAGFTFACARRMAGDVWCWGSDADGQLGDGPSSRHDCDPGAPDAPCARDPVRVEGLSDAIDIATGLDYACALRATGAIVCWGDNHFGQLGDETFVDRHAPVAVSGL